MFQTLKSDENLSNPRYFKILYYKSQCSVDCCFEKPNLFQARKHFCAVKDVLIAAIN